MRLTVSQPRAFLASALLTLLVACGPRFVDGPPADARPQLEPNAFVASDGIRLPLHRWAPVDEPAGVVVALHSFGDFGLAFAALGPQLADAGFLVLAPDQRGFGAAPTHGRWWGHERMVMDAVELARAAQTATGAARLHLIGESMGGAVAMLAAVRSNREGGLSVGRIAVAAPAVRDELANRALIDTALQTAAFVWPSYTTTVEHGAPHHRPTAAHRLATDPRVLREVRADTYWGLIRLANAASALSPADLPPMLVQFGTDDDTIPRVSACALIEGLEPPHQARLYAGAGHRLWQDERGRPAERAVVRWLAAARIAPLAKPQAADEVATGSVPPARFCADMVED